LASVNAARGRVGNVKAARTDEGREAITNRNLSVVRGPLLVEPLTTDH